MVETRFVNANSHVFTIPRSGEKGLLHLLSALAILMILNVIFRPGIKS
jgi:hypothetical protein